MSDIGEKVVSYAYDPYGNIRSAPGMATPIAWYNILTYTGAMKDNQTGLIRMGVRWYDPNTGRFTTPDPTAQETNPYLYAGGNPCNNTDPTGGDCLGDMLLFAGAGLLLGAAAAQVPTTPWGWAAIGGAGLIFYGSARNASNSCR